MPIDKENDNIFYSFTEQIFRKYLHGHKRNYLEFEKNIKIKNFAILMI